MKTVDRLMTLCLCIFLLLTACGKTQGGAASALPAQTVEPPAAAVPEIAVPEEPLAPVFRNTIKAHRAELDTALDAIASAYGVTGCSVAAFENESIVYSHSYGYARPDSGTLADENTKYRIASISKLVTAMLAMQLEEQGKFTLQDDIAVLINPKLQNPFYPEEKTTVEMLLTHTSGIVDGAGYGAALQRGRFPPLDEVLSYNNFSGEKPGESYCYTNFGMGLVAGVVEQASGEYFYDYARDALFAPLQMDAAFITDYIEDKNSLASYAFGNPLQWGSMKEIYGRIPQGQMYLLGQGELYISANNLAELAIILAGNGTYQGKRFLTEESLKQLHTQQVQDPLTGERRGLVVQILPDVIENTTLYGHQGNAYGVIDFLFYDPLTHRGVVFLNNGASAEKRTVFSKEEEPAAQGTIYTVNEAVLRELWQYLLPSQH